MDLKIKELCDQRGIKSAYELAKKTGYDHKKDKQDAGAFNMPTAYRAYANNIQRFELETLATLCRVLDCTPNDIFGFETPRNMPVIAPIIAPESPVARSEAESRQSARAESEKPQDLPELADGDEWLSTEQVARSIGISERSVRDMYLHKKFPLPRFETTKGSFVKVSDLSQYMSERDKRIIKKAKGL